MPKVVTVADQKLKWPNYIFIVRDFRRMMFMLERLSVTKVFINLKDAKNAVDRWLHE